MPNNNKNPLDRLIDEAAGAVIVKYLQEKFPNTLPQDKQTTIREVDFRMGQQDVIEHLRVKFNAK